MSTLHRSITGSPLERHRTVRGHDFYPPAEVLAQIPRLYGTEPVPTGDKTIWLHSFAGPCDWWVAEYTPPPVTRSATPASVTRTTPNGATPTSPTSKRCTPPAASPPPGRSAPSGCCPGCWSNATWIGPPAPSPGSRPAPHRKEQPCPSPSSPATRRRPRDRSPCGTRWCPGRFPVVCAAAVPFAGAGSDCPAPARSSDGRLRGQGRRSRAQRSLEGGGAAA